MREKARERVSLGCFCPERRSRACARLQADEEPTKKSRSFRKFTFRGVDLDQLLDLTTDELVQLFHARARRRCAARQAGGRQPSAGAPAQRVRVQRCRRRGARLGLSAAC